MIGLIFILPAYKGYFNTELRSELYSILTTMLAILKMTRTKWLSKTTMHLIYEIAAKTNGAYIYIELEITIEVMRHRQDQSGQSIC